MKIAHGVLCWCSTERRTNRYGSIHLGADTFEGKVCCTPSWDLEALMKLEGRKVRMWCVVLESRPSGHAGDASLKIFPSQPEVGATVELGVGYLDSEVSYDGTPQIVLRPNDAREDLWIDPRQLYRLHDQTVDVMVEETDLPVSPKANLVTRNGVFVNPDGSVQAKLIPEQEFYNKLEPIIQPIGHGMFSVSRPYIEYSDEET